MAPKVVSAPGGWSKLLMVLEPKCSVSPAQTRPRFVLCPRLAALSYAVRQGIQGATFHCRVLTQLPMSSVSTPHTHCGCQKAPGQLLSIPQNSRALHLGDEGEGQVGSISGKQEVISLKDLGEVFPPTPSPPPKHSQPGQPEAGS